MSRSISQYWKGAKAFTLIKAREAAGKPVLTTISEAQRRANICMAGAHDGQPCPKNRIGDVSALEKATDDMIKRQVDGRTLEKEEKLGHCTVCSCNLKSLVHMLPEVIMLGAGRNYLSGHPKFCWKQSFKQTR